MSGNSDYKMGKPSIDYTTKLMSPKGRGPAVYLEVKYRLQLLRELFPEAEVITDNTHLDLEKQFAVFHARVVLPNGSVGEGTGSESADDFRDYIEKAETKAIGRALTAAGIGHQYGIADFEYESESRKDYVGVDSAVPPERRTPTPARQQPAATPPPQPRPATPSLLRQPEPRPFDSSSIVVTDYDETDQAQEERDSALVNLRARIGVVAIQNGCAEIYRREMNWRELTIAQQKGILAWGERQTAAPAQETD